MFMAFRFFVIDLFVYSSKKIIANTNFNFLGKKIS